MDKILKVVFIIEQQEYPPCKQKDFKSTKIDNLNPFKSKENQLNSKGQGEFSTIDIICPKNRT